MKRKTDPMIGIRAAEELQRLFPVKRDGDMALGCGNHTFYEWLHGRAPSAINLQRMMELGADVKYILSGKREAKCHERC